MGKRRKTDSIVVHCSDTPTEMDIGVDEIRNWHVNERKWSDVGYHLIIRRSGTIELGRPLDDIGAHAYGMNQSSIGICMVGGRGDEGEPEANFTEEQYASLKLVVPGCIAGYPGIKIIIGHDQVPQSGKTCPNFDVSRWLVEQGIRV